jgi:hypothetical protein
VVNTDLSFDTREDCELARDEVIAGLTAGGSWSPSLHALDVYDAERDLEVCHATDSGRQPIPLSR